MAKYDDYVKDELSQEIDEAQENQRARDEETGRFVPDRFKGKSAEEIAQSYIELEKMNSRQAQDLGQMRRTVDQLLELQSQKASSPEPEVTATPVTVDDIYEDPDGAFRRVAKEVTSGEVSDLRKELQQMRMERKLATFDEKFPNWREVVREAEFLDWAQASPYRMRLVQEGDSGDLEAAEEVLGYYYESKARAEQSDEPPRQHPQAQRLRDAITESSSPAQAEVVEEFSRSELLEKRIAAQQGSLAAERWLKAHGAAIQEAYAEGRIVD